MVAGRRTTPREESHFSYQSMFLVVIMLLMQPSRALRLYGRVFASNTNKIMKFSLSSSNSDDFGYTNDEVTPSSQTGPNISWYPGHIAKAERELAEYLKKVDVVIEVRDARIPFSTMHPKVPEWIGSKPLIVAIARLDQISTRALNEWKEYYAMNPAHKERPDAKVFFIDGKLGAGVLTLKKQALKAGIAINEKRIKRGIQPRAVRAAVIGFPNVGKSALINRLLGKTMARSRNLPGVTRSMQWIRLGGREIESTSQENVIELLDSPGIIPARQFDQNSALALAICNDIGEASYDRIVVAAAMCDRINQLYTTHKSYVDIRKICDRYEIAFKDMTGEEIVHTIAEKFYHGNQISAADRLLGDFRRNYMGYGSLEAPPAKRIKKDAHMTAANTDENEVNEMAKKKASNTANIVNLDIGKGNYEGW